MSPGGTIFKGSRALKGRERLYLFGRWAMYTAGQVVILAPFCGFVWWALASDDNGLRFMAAVLGVPAAAGTFWLAKAARPFGQDLLENKVESIIGAIGGLDLTRGLVPLHMGPDIYHVQSELLRRKREGEPIMVEILRHSHLAVTIDGRSNLMSYRRWVELGGQEIG